MKSIYVADVILVVPSELRRAAAEVASRITGNPEDNTEAFFSRALERIDDHAQTHYLASVLSTQETIDRLPELAQAFPGSHWTVWRDAATRERLVEVSGWLAARGLQYIPDPPEEL